VSFYCITHFSSPALWLIKANPSRIQVEVCPGLCFWFSQVDSFSFFLAAAYPRNVLSSSSEDNLRSRGPAPGATDVRTLQVMRCNVSEPYTRPLSRNRRRRECVKARHFPVVGTNQESFMVLHEHLRKSRGQEVRRVQEPRRVHLLLRSRVPKDGMEAWTQGGLWGKARGREGRGEHPGRPVRRRVLG